MLHPLIRLVVSQPQLLSDHAEAYVDLFSQEACGLVARLKRERGARCERCGSDHRLIGDHVVERRDGGAELDPANVELLCQACHNRKTAAARARRAAGGA